MTSSPHLALCLAYCGQSEDKVHTCLSSGQSRRHLGTRHPLMRCLLGRWLPRPGPWEALALSTSWAALISES